MPVQCNAIHRSIVEVFKTAIVYGKSVKHQPQRVGLGHELCDEDVGELNPPDPKRRPSGDAGKRNFEAPQIVCPTLVGMSRIWLAEALPPWSALRSQNCHGAGWIL